MLTRRNGMKPSVTGSAWLRPGTAGAVVAALWVAAAAGVSYYGLQAHRDFRSSLIRAFEEQQEFNASLIKQLLENHIRESVRDLQHLAHMYTASPPLPPDYGKPAARILRDHSDDFQAIAVIGPGGDLLHHTSGPGARNPLACVALERVDAASATQPFMSERVLDTGGRPLTYLFVPTHLPAPGGPRHLIVGELDLRQFMVNDLAGLARSDTAVVLADHAGDIYFISSLKHERLRDMERGSIFPPGPECLSCHREEGFEDIRHTMETGGVGHKTFRSPDGRLIDRTSLMAPVLNEKWIVSISVPYARVQGQINANARRHALVTIVLLSLLGAGAVFTGRYRRRRDLQRHYYSIIDSIRVGMCRLSAEGEILGANPAFADLFGLEPGQVTRRDFTALAADAGAARAFLQGVVGRGATMDYELQLSHAGGGRFTGALSGVVVRDGNGRRLQVDVAVQDVTARKRAEEELRTTKELLERQNEELRKLDRMKDALLRDVAHELKTPVAKHAMQLEILKPMLQAHSIQEHELRAFQVMDESIRRQQGVIRNLLNLARLEAGGRQYRRENFRLDGLLALVQADYQYAIDTLGIAFELASPPITIRSDEEMLWHVFSNLVSNAIKFRRPGVPPRIAVRAAASGDRVSVRVEDNGIGVQPPEQEKVFARFYQATASTEGSGVGLSICRNIVTDLGGRIWLTSPGPGAGAVVEVELPLG